MLPDLPRPGIDPIAREAFLALQQTRQIQRAMPQAYALPVGPKPIEFMVERLHQRGHAAGPTTTIDALRAADALSRPASQPTWSLNSGRSTTGWTSFLGDTPAAGPVQVFPNGVVLPAPDWGLFAPNGPQAASIPTGTWNDTQPLLKQIGEMTLELKRKRGQQPRDLLGPDPYPLPPTPTGPPGAGGMIGAASELTNAFAGFAVEGQLTAMVRSGLIGRGGTLEQNENYLRYLHDGSNLPKSAERYADMVNAMNVLREQFAPRQRKAF